MKQHTTPTEAKEAFLQMFEELSADGQWMAVAFKPTSDGEIQFCKTSSRFPTDRFVKCLQALKTTLDREQGIHFEPEPLPLARHVIGEVEGSGRKGPMLRPISEEDLERMEKDNGEASFKLKIEDSLEEPLSKEEQEDETRNEND